MKKVFALMTAVALIGATFAGCAASGSSSSSASSKASVSGSITAAGSSALAPLVSYASKQFKKSNPDVSITVNAGGSGVGLQQVAAKSIDIGDSDVPASTKLSADLAKNLVDHKVCVVGVAAIVSSDVSAKVTNLTTDQLISIFTGKTTNWKDVGGDDEKITLVTRPTSSGTRALFKQYALNNNEEATSSLSTDDSGTLLQYVQQNKGAIGYVALSYLVNTINVKPVSIDGVEPSLDNIYSGKYKVWGDEHMYTYGEATGAAKAFFDYFKTTEFQSQMETLGYGVSSKMKVSHDSTSSSSSSSASSSSSSK